MYQVLDVYTDTLVGKVYPNREAAKRSRNTRNSKFYNRKGVEEVVRTDAMPRFVVSRAPSHPKGVSARLPKYRVDMLVSKNKKLEKSAKVKEEKTKRASTKTR